MTVVHFVNCMALTFVPPWIIYESKLTGYATVSQMAWAGLYYALSQLAQMVLTATFVPSSETGAFDLTQELEKAFIGFADVYGLFYLLNTKKGYITAVTIGLAWATAESVFRRLVPLVVEARSMQFSWKHTLTAVEANISVGTHMALAMLIFVGIRTRKSSMRNTAIAAIVFQRFGFPVITSCLKYAVFSSMPAIAVVAEAAMSVGLVLFTWQLFQNYQKETGRVPE
mmetsp:Transcript_22052/g.44386  ORF Transcript_22052/g.44386 Transcript_22052/m.44386 type:complete len:227 (-) Transcript_22052:89-769(-)